MREWLDGKIYGRKNGEPQMRVRDFQTYLNETLLEPYMEEGMRGISLDTAHRWLQDLGFRWRRHRKCVYADGHNRPDNIKRRMEYVAEMMELQKRTVKLRKIGEGSEAKEVALWPAVCGGEDSGAERAWMHVELAGECAWEKRHNLSMSGELDKIPREDRLRLWCTERQREAAQPLPTGFRLLGPQEVMEVVYHDECAYKQNDGGGAAWENDKKGAAMNPKNEGAAVMVSSAIGEERGQLDVPEDVYAIMKEQGKIPKMETTGDGARLSSSEYYIGRCKPCEE
ncbi:unnamed protein product, partial [Ectocarpus sp. 12 AP-2014]